MIHSIARTIHFAAVFGAIASSIYYVLCLWSASAFLRARKLADADFERSTSKFTPAISILKPLKGIDPQINLSLRSHCLQDYPEYEIVFGVNDATDPAIAEVKKLQREFPDRGIRLLVCSEILGGNVKVSNLAQMIGAAHHDYLLVNDSDIRVDADYLLRGIAPLANPEVGLVTCLYRGIAGLTLGSRLESLGISTDFCAGILAALKLEGGIRFGLGSTLVFRRGDLEKIGGFESFVDYLADDYELGKRLTESGLTVLLSDVVVETLLPAYGIGQFLRHQLRWGRAVRDSRPGGYVGLIFTFGLLWSLLAVLSDYRGRWSWGLSWSLLTTTIVLRTAVAVVVGKLVLRDRQLFRSLWLIPLRDMLAVCVWIASLVGNTVTWRGDRFRLKNGKLERVAG